VDGFDQAIMEFLNKFSHRSWTFDATVAFLTQTNLMKAAPLVAVLWGMWFLRDREGRGAEARKTILATFAGMFVALVILKVLLTVLPFRLRPFEEPSLHFIRPYGLATAGLESHTSFPSGHAVMAGVLVTGIFLVCRNLGIMAAAFALLGNLLARVYLGLHYPTDIIGGALIGAGCVLAANAPRCKRAIADPLLALERAHPGLFHFLFFLVAFQAAVLFRDVQTIGTFVLEMVRTVGPRLF